MDAGKGKMSSIAETQGNKEKVGDMTRNVALDMTKKAGLYSKGNIKNAELLGVSNQWNNIKKSRSIQSEGRRHLEEGGPLSVDSQDGEDQPKGQLEQMNNHLGL